MIKQALQFLVILIIAFILSACPEETAEKEKKDQPFALGDAKVSAYIRTWGIPAAWREDGKPSWNAKMIKGEYISDLIISFALISKSDGFSIYINEVVAGTFSNLWDEVAALKQKYPNLNVTFSVGGANEAGFSDMADNPVKRAGFIANVCDWLERYNLEGVDIDWEYPVGPSWGQSIPSKPADRQNYISLLQELRDAMDLLKETTGKRYSLSTAVPAGSWFLQRNDVKAASEIVDSLKLMTYDYYGSWSSRTGHNAGLFKNPRDPENMSSDISVTNYINAGIKPEKIMLGVGFYGRMWRGVSQGAYSATPGLFQSYTSIPFGGYTTWTDIKQIYLKSGSGYTRYWDSSAKAPFLYNGDIWITYTDEEQIRAIGAYAKEKNLGGVFTWEYANDMSGELIKVLAESVR